MWWGKKTSVNMRSWLPDPAERGDIRGAVAVFAKSAGGGWLFAVRGKKVFPACGRRSGS
jgi:hypothetical protein